MSQFPDMLTSFREFFATTFLAFLLLLAVFGNGPSDPPPPKAASGYHRPLHLPYLPEDHVEPAHPVEVDAVPTFLDLMLEGLEDDGFCYCLLKASGKPCLNCQDQARRVAQAAVAEQGVGE